jgi:hypothetical protein
MLKRLAVLCVLVGVSLAAAATLKMKWFCWTDEIGDKDGVATLHYVPGAPGGNETKIHVTITGFAPDTPYDVCIRDFDPNTPCVPSVGGCTVGGSILTNNGGNGEVNLSNSFDMTGTPQTVTIYQDINQNGVIDVNEPVFAIGLAQ